MDEVRSILVRTILMNWWLGEDYSVSERWWVMTKKTDHSDVRGKNTLRNNHISDRNYLNIIGFNTNFLAKKFVLDCRKM